MRSRLGSPFLFLVLLLWAALPRAGGADELPNWARGPVRYLAEKEELELYRKLERDEQRALFVERFWARRDPTPETMTNEYRELFWERVRYANERFLDSSKPGWQTDRGKVHILYGEPSEIEDHADLRSGGDLTGGHGVVRWIYRGRPAGRSDLNPLVIVPFQRDTSGEYRLSTDPALSSVFFDALAYREETPMQRALQNFYGSGAPTAGPSQLAVMLDLGKMQEVPPHAQVILERVETLENYRVRPLEVEISRFRHPSQSGTLALLTVDVSHVAAEVVPALVARLSPRDPELLQRVLAEGAFSIVEVGGQRYAQGRVVLAPGDYDLMLMVVDPLDEVPGVRRESLTIADLSGSTLRFSDVVRAADVASLRFAALASYDEPFHIGPYRVVPGLGKALAPGSAVKLFYEVYEGRPPYQVAYVLEGLELDGTWKRLGRPFEAMQEGAAQAWELTTGESWPLGDYRVRIELKDQEGRTAESVLSFELVSPPAVSSRSSVGPHAP